MFPTSNNLVVALCATIGALIAAIPIFLSALQERLDVLVYAWGVVYVVLKLSLDSQEVVSKAFESILSAWIGAGLGVLFYFISGLILDSHDLSADTYEQHAIATALVGVALPLLGLARWEITVFVAYVTTTFGESECVSVTISAALGYTIGPLVTLLMLSLAYSVFPSTRKRKTIGRTIDEFRTTHSLWFEGLFHYFLLSTILHGEELTRRQEDASRSVMNLLEVIEIIHADPLNKLSPEDRDRLEKWSQTVSWIHIELVTIRGALSRKGLDMQLIQQIGVSTLLTAVKETKMQILMALRPHSDNEICFKACSLILERIGAYESNLLKLNRLNAPEAKPPDDARDGEFPIHKGRRHRSTISLLDAATEDTARFFFFVDRVLKLAYLSREFAYQLHSLERIVANDGGGSLTTRITSFKEDVVHTIKWVFGRSVIEFPSLRADYPFIMKTILTNQFVMQLVLYLRYQYGASSAFVSSFVLIADLYLLSCIPSIGDVLVRGKLRCLAIVVSSVFVCILFLTSPASATIFLSLTIVVFSGKFNEFNPVIGTAAGDFVTAFVLNVLPLYDLSDGGTFDYTGTSFLTISMYRAACIAIGFAFSLVCASVIFPDYDSVKFRKACGKSVLEIYKLSLDTLTDIVTAFGTKAHSITTKDDLTKRFASTVNEYKDLRKLSKPAKAEAALLSKRKRNRVPLSLTNLIKAEDGVYRLSNMAFSFSLVTQESLSKAIDHMHRMTDQNTRTIVLEIVDLMDQLRANFKSCGESLVTAISNPDDFPARSLKDCVFDWSGLASSIFRIIISFNSSQVDFHSSDRLLIFGLQKIIFSLIIFLTAWDTLIFAIDPSAVFDNERRRTGVASYRGVRMQL